MSRTQTTTMPPYAQPSQRYCRDCQYCDDCDPSPHRPADVPRICDDHRQRTRFIERDQITAVSHRCSGRAPPGARPSSAQQPRNPPTAQSSQTPLEQFQQTPNNGARKGATFNDVRTSDWATARVGFDYREIPDTEGPMVFTGIVSSGHASVHAGNTYGYEDPRVAGPPAQGSQPGVHGLGAEQPLYFPPTNPFANNFQTNNPWRNNPYRSQ